MPSGSTAAPHVSGLRDGGGMTISRRPNRVLQKAIHRAGGQAVLAGINPPLSVREFIQAVWRSKPHRAIGSLQDGSNRVGAQTIRSAIRLEAAVSEAAKSSAQRSNPNGSFTLLVHS